MPPDSDPFDDPAARAWAAAVLADLVPKIAGSAVLASIVPQGPADVKFAVELGLGIMLDKPMILVVRPGTAVPEKLAGVADAMVEDVPGRRDLTAAAIRDALDRITGALP